MRRRLDSDGEVRSYFDRETTKLPGFYLGQIREELGPLWDWLPAGALEHDPHAYRKSVDRPALAALEPSPEAMLVGA